MRIRSVEKSNMKINQIDLKLVWSKLIYKLFDFEYYIDLINRIESN